MEPAALRWPAAPGTEAPRGSALGRSPAPSAPSSTSDWQCDAPEREGIPEVPRRARRPCLGVAFRPFCYPGRGTGFCFRSRDLGWGRFRLSGPGNSRRCHGTRHLLRGAAFRGTRHGVRGIPFRTTRRADLGALQLWPPALPRPTPPGFPSAPSNRGPEP